MNGAPIDPKRAVELYRGGLHLRQVARKMRCSHEGVRQILIRQGVMLRNRRGAEPQPPPLPPLAEELFFDLEDIFREGASLDQLTDWLGEPRLAIADALKVLLRREWAICIEGLYFAHHPMCGPRKAYDYDLGTVEQMVAAKTLTFDQIAAKLGITKGVVAGVANRARRRAA
jgi:hypothetical protein